MVGSDESFQIVGVGTQDLVQGAVEGQFERPIRFRGNQVGMRAQQRVQRVRMEILSKDIYGVRAVQSERGVSEQLVPQLFEANGGSELAGLPQQRYHLTVGANAAAIRRSPEAPQGGADGSLEQWPIRLASRHKPPERIESIQVQQLPIAFTPGDIDAHAGEFAGKE